MIKVYVLAETRLYREGLADVLATAGFDVTGFAGDLESAAPALTDAPPNIVVLDVAGAGGIGSIGRLNQVAPGVAVVAFGVGDSESEIVACAELGARGYVTRDHSREDLVDVVQSVARGDTVCSPQVAVALMQRVAALTSTEPDRNDVQLTRRELEIATLVEEGLSNKEIASRLFIEVATVKTHVHNILEKLRVGRRADAAAWVRRRSELRRLR